MEVRRESKHESAVGWQGRYWKASREEKGKLLDEFVGRTCYHRKYAMTIPRHGPPEDQPCGRGERHPIVHGPAVLAAPEVAAEAAGWISGKRLGPVHVAVGAAPELEGRWILMQR